MVSARRPESKSMKHWLIAALLFAGLHQAVLANDSVPVFSFASEKAAIGILTAHDEFVQRLSPFDRASRLKTDRVISEEVFLRHVAEQVRPWTADEKSIVESALATIRPRLAEFSLDWPKEIVLIKTSGNEEGGAAYTRGRAIILPSRVLASTSERLTRVLAHEIFHVLTRENPVLKEKLYGAIGFQRCGELSLPAKLKLLKITNPDAPRNEHCIRLQADGAPTWAIPVLYSRAAIYDPLKGGEFFDYLQFKFLLLDQSIVAAPVAALKDESALRLLDLDAVSGFYEQVGRNTGYIVHAEEILADNFALLVLGPEDVRSPEILRKMKEILHLQDASMRH
jgi:hypothetical protein